MEPTQWLAKVPERWGLSEAVRHSWCSANLLCRARHSRISKRGNRYLRVLFVQATWVVLAKKQMWKRYGLEGWIAAAQKRLHPNVLEIALTNKLARIARAVLARAAISR